VALPLLLLIFAAAQRTSVAGGATTGAGTASTFAIDLRKTKRSTHP